MKGSEAAQEIVRDGGSATSIPTDVSKQIEVKDYEANRKILVHKMRTIDSILHTSRLTGLNLH